MSQETMGNLIGAAILVPFLILVFLAGQVLARFQGRRLSRALEPLASLVNGKVSSDGNNGFLVGAYGGRRVQVRICPKTGGLGGYSPHGTSVYNRLLSKPTAQPEIKPAMLNVLFVRLRFSA
jgi:hypothetical protein